MSETTQRVVPQYMGIDAFMRKAINRNWVAKLRGFSASPAFDEALKEQSDHAGENGVFMGLPYSVNEDVAEGLVLVWRAQRS